ncbi:MAG: hypothetical protein LBU89_14655 [Fibromonadaceae bacterium]|jgi:hypothetical protein|nr:hypothetical protein [Fibromonadaceae bacterium]
MKTATAATEPYSKVIDLGNGVMFPVKSEREASFVEWMIEKAKAGKASLPKRAPGTFVIPIRSNKEPVMSTEEFEAFYEEARADRF